MKKLVLFTLSLLLLISGCGKDKPAPESRVTVTALKYGDSMFPESLKFREKKDSVKQIPFGWMFFLIKYQDRVILVDTGFKGEKFRSLYEIDNYRDPIDILDEYGYTPDDITDVILTHSHFDHIGLVYKFPNSNIYLQRDECERCKMYGEFPEVREFLKTSDKLTLFDDRLVIFDKFVLKKVGVHSPGSCMLYFKQDNKRIILAGDDLTRDIIPMFGENGVDEENIYYFHDPDTVTEGFYKELIK